MKRKGKIKIMVGVVSALTVGFLVMNFNKSSDVIAVNDDLINNNKTAVTNENATNNNKVPTVSEAASQKVDKKKIAVASTGFADEDHEISMEEVVEGADLIIRGETIDYKGYMEGPGNIWTTEYVRVVESVRGDVAVGDIIEIDKMGGYVLLSEFIAIYEEPYRQSIRETDFAQYTDEQLESEYISLTMADDAKIEIGKISTFYLINNGEWPYSRVEGKHGEIVEVEGSGVASSYNDNKINENAEVNEEMHEINPTTNQGDGDLKTPEQHISSVPKISIIP